jgi:mannose-6-phosphate isomerase
VVALLLMREVTLAPGETLFVPPGQLHCYLAGTACEVQVSSDNVLRAGLTAKHVDIDGVLELLDTRAGALPPVPVSDVGVERVFQPPVEEFALAAIADVPTPTPLAEVPGPALLMCLQGRYQVFAGDNDSMELGQGEAAYVPARDPALRVRGVGVLLRLTGNRAG